MDEKRLKEIELDYPDSTENIYDYVPELIAEVRRLQNKEVVDENKKMGLREEVRRLQQPKLTPSGQSQEIQSLRALLVERDALLREAREMILALNENDACEPGGQFGPEFVCGVHRLTNKIDAAIGLENKPMEEK